MTKRKYIRIFLAVLLIILLSGCGKTAPTDTTKITSKSLSTTAELSDYEIIDGNFHAVVTLENAPSLSDLADADSIADWSTQFEPYLTFADGTQTSLAIGDTTVNQKGNTVTVSFEVSTYILSQDLDAPLDLSIHIAEFEDEFELHDLQAS